MRLFFFLVTHIDGNPVQVYFSLFGELRETDLRLNPVIVKDQAVTCTVQKMRL